MTRIKDYSNELFDVKQISCIIKQPELNPFESSVTLRHPTLDSKDFFNHQFVKYIVSNKLFVFESNDGEDYNYLEQTGSTYITINKTTSAV